MNHQTFIDQIKAYYGDYPDKSKVETYVMHYLKSDIDPDSLDRLFKYVCRSHPVNYGPPDIAALEGAIIWALKNTHNAIDVHRSDVNAGRNELPVILDEEYQEGKKMLDERGGLGGMLKDVVQTMDIDGNVERREPYVD